MKAATRKGLTVPPTNPPVARLSDETYWCVQGLLPADDIAPEERWVTLYHALTESEGKRMLRVTMEAWDKPEHDRYDDFRLRPPLRERPRQRTALVEGPRRGAPPARAGATAGRVRRSGGRATRRR